MKKIKKYLLFSVMSLAITSVAACNTAGTYDVNDRRDIRPFNVNERYNRGVDLDRTNIMQDRGFGPRGVYDRGIGTPGAPGLDRPILNVPPDRNQGIFAPRDRTLMRDRMLMRDRTRTGVGLREGGTFGGTMRGTTTGTR